MIRTNLSPVKTVVKLLLLGCCSFLGAGHAQAIPSTQINDFETTAEQAMLSPTPPPTKVVTSFVTGAGVTHGTKALKLQFKVGGGSYPTADVTLPATQDWSNSGALAMSVYNPGASDVTFYLRADDDNTSDYYIWINTVKAGQTIKVQQSLFTQQEIAGDIVPTQGYQMVPWVGLGDDTAVYVLDSSPPDRAHINKLAFQLLSAPTGSDTVLIIDNLHLVPGPKITGTAYGDSTVNSFENATETGLVSTTHPGISSITYQASPGGGMTVHGSKVMKVVWQANSGVSYPGLKLTPPDSPADWAGMAGAGLALNVYNPGTSSIPLGLLIKDDSGATRYAYFSVPAATAGKWVMPFYSRAGLGMATVTDMGVSPSAGFVDLQHVSEIKLYYNTSTGPSTTVTAYIDHFRVKTGNIFTGMVDQYGQYARADWPGKVYFDSELTAARTSEASTLTPMSGRDIYGGWSGHGTWPGSGSYFRTWYDSDHDKWWFVAPTGNKFFSTGMNCLSVEIDATFIDNTHLTSPPPVTLDRTGWFNPPLPDPDSTTDPLSDFYVDLTAGRPPFDTGGLAYQFGMANVYRKYFPGSGADWYDDWKDDQEKRMKSWGFNTVGAWSTGMTGQINVPFVVEVTSANGNDPYDRFSSPYQTSLLPDPWDKNGQATEGLYRAVQRNLNVAGNYITSSYLLGYMVDNELSWGIESSVDYQRYNIAWGVLQINTTAAGQSAAKDVFIADMAAKYSTVAALNAAWGTSFTGSSVTAALRPAYSPSLSTVLTAAAKTDYGDFVSKYSDKYFSVVRAAIKDRDPNHLYLGCRFAQFTQRTVKEAAKSVDVLSFNYYRDFNPADWAWISDTSVIPTRKPAMITEYSYGAHDRGSFGPTSSAITVPTQAERANRYETYTNNVASMKYFIGAHWFEYYDMPVLGRNVDNSTGNYGFISITDTPFPEMVNKAKTVNANIYTAHD